MKKGFLMVDDGIVDEVAVARALEGDPSVWPRLRPGERREVYGRVIARREAELALVVREVALRKAVLGVSAGAGPRNEDEQGKYQDWLVKAAQAAGYSHPSVLLDTARKNLSMAGVL